MIVFSISITGCVTYKVDSGSVSTPDYNQRVVISDPHYDNVITPIGVTSIAASTIGAGYLAYNSDIIRVNNGPNPTTLKAGNALLGAALGFGTSYLFTRLVGLGKTRQASDYAKWVKKANKKYVILPSDKLLVMPRNAEPSFKIKNTTDAEQFASVFPNSYYRDSVFSSGIKYCNRTELPRLISLFPTTTLLPIAKDKYISQSPSYNEIVSARNLYPEINKSYENNFLNLIANCSNSIDFKTRFPKSIEFKRSYLNAFKTDNQLIKEFESLNKTYLGSINVRIDDLLKESGIIQRNYVNSQYGMDKHNDPDFLVDIYNQFSLLNYSLKKRDFLNYYFAKLDNNFTDGDEVIWRFNQLKNSSKYPTVNANSNEIKEIISKKLSEEASQKVQLKSQYQLTNSNSQWDSWLSSNYTAGLVGEKGAMYILYGEVSNNSKYSIPVEIACTSGLQYEITSTGVLEGLRKLAGVRVTREVAGTQSASFYIPSLPAKSSGAYALKLNFADNYQRGGVNVLDIFKVVFNAQLKNLKITAGYSETAEFISQSVLNTQKEYQQFVLNGLPDRSLGDIWRGEDVDADVWNEKWQKIQEEIRRAEEYRRLHPEKFTKNSNNQSNDEEKSISEEDDNNENSTKETKTVEFRPAKETLENGEIDLPSNSYKIEKGSKADFSPQGLNGMYYSHWVKFSELNGSGYQANIYEKDDGSVFAVDLNDGDIFWVKYNSLENAIKAWYIYEKYSVKLKKGLM